jgi:hypothetical protein
VGVRVTARVDPGSRPVDHDPPTRRRRAST